MVGFVVSVSVGSESFQGWRRHKLAFVRKVTVQNSWHTNPAALLTTILGVRDCFRETDEPVPEGVCSPIIVAVRFVPASPPHHDTCKGRSGQVPYSSKEVHPETMSTSRVPAALSATLLLSLCTLPARVAAGGVGSLPDAFALEYYEHYAKGPECTSECLAWNEIPPNMRRDLGLNPHEGFFGDGSKGRAADPGSMWVAADDGGGAADQTADDSAFALPVTDTPPDSGAAYITTAGVKMVKSAVCARPKRVEEKGASPGEAKQPWCFCVGPKAGWAPCVRKLRDCAVEECYHDKFLCSNRLTQTCAPVGGEFAAGGTGGGEDGGSSGMSLFAQSRKNWLFLENEFHYGVRENGATPPNHLTAHAKALYEPGSGLYTRTQRGYFGKGCTQIPEDKLLHPFMNFGYESRNIVPSGGIRDLIGGHWVPGVRSANLVPTRPKARLRRDHGVVVRNQRLTYAEQLREVPVVDKVRSASRTVSEIIKNDGSGGATPNDFGLHILDLETTGRHNWVHPNNVTKSSSVGYLICKKG